ncbi:TetR/AcrR family transcriptional regulator [Nocardiopsis potens]|uniref:TetR/AcrR family transcriptional regulator n=1 Tax=Nocardiopsis potens TaxID=1246458 RepID=UPI00034683E0|nr:TetR/AcrR family transcriptional regulator [Nocardiopsis potens]
MPTHARERLIAAAEKLFYSDGIHAVGVDRLLSASGIGRASFYRHFTSKDDLVVEIIERYDRRWRDALEEAVRAQSGDPLAVFDALGAQFAAPEFRGCASINAMVEVADPESRAYQVAVRHKHLVIAFLSGLLKEAGVDGHEAMAQRFMMLMDGATVTALRERDPSPARDSKEIARGLMERPPGDGPEAPAAPARSGAGAGRTGERRDGPE